MIFPEEIWNIIKGFLLVKLDGFLWGYLRLFQRDGFALQCHMYYQILATERGEIIGKMAEIGEQTFRKLRYTASRVILHDAYYAAHVIEDEDDVWCTFEEESGVSFQCVKVMRIINKFSEICTHAHIKILLEMLHEASKILDMRINMIYNPSCIESCYRTIYNGLYTQVSRQNRIKFVWKPDYRPPQIKLISDIP